MSDHPGATIIVLNWNGRSYLEACLSALLRQSHRAERIVLVDNNSTDDSVAFVQEKFPIVEIVQNERNLGYAGGNNTVLRDLGTELAILVNPDIVVSEGWLGQMIEAFAADVSTGIVGCKLHYPNGRLQHAGGLITHPQALPQHRGMYEEDNGQFDGTADVDFVTGATIAVRRSMLERVGLLDEGFFMYFEDADWCARARRSGYRVVYAPQAVAIHDESALAVRGSYSYLHRFHSGRWRYLLKHFTIDEIFGETFPAEEAWLEDMKGDDRRALGRAYRDTALNLHQIMQARLVHGGAEISQNDQKEILEELLNLRRTAMLSPIDSVTWHEFTAAGQIKPSPFSSNTPVLGPLFARLRDLWAGVAAKPYIGALNQQQVDFNQAFAGELQAVEERLITFSDKWLRLEADQREMIWEMRAMQQEIDQTRRLLAELEAKLDQRDDQLS